MKQSRLRFPLAFALLFVSVISFAAPAGKTMHARPHPFVYRHGQLCESVVVVDNNTDVLFTHISIQGKDYNGVDFSYSYNVSVAPGDSYTLPDSIFDGIAEIDNVTVTANHSWEGGVEVYDADYNLLYNQSKQTYEPLSFSFSVPSGAFTNCQELVRLQFWF
jgi:hypothetical protein